MYKTSIRRKWSKKKFVVVALDCLTLFVVVLCLQLHRSILLPDLEISCDFSYSVYTSIGFFFFFGIVICHLHNIADMQCIHSLYGSIFCVNYNFSEYLLSMLETYVRRMNKKFSENQQLQRVLQIQHMRLFFLFVDRKCFFVLSSIVFLLSLYLSTFSSSEKQPLHFSCITLPSLLLFYYLCRHRIFLILLVILVHIKAHQYFVWVF